jgi:iron complex outermembrane receptor protein
MRVDLSPDTRIKLIANLFNMPYAKDPLGLTLAQLISNPKQAGNNAVVNDARKTVTQEQLGAVLEHQIDFQTRVQARVYGGARENLQYQAGSATAGSWVGLDRNFHGLGLQVQGKNQRLANQSFDWVVGFDQDFSGEMRQGGPANAGAKVGSINRSEMNESTNSDYFAQANWRLLPQLSITTGLRSSTIQLQSRDDYLVDGANGSGKVTYKAVNPVLGATWHVNDVLNLYLNSGRGFETPTLSESVYTKSGSAVLGLFNSNLVPSRSQHLELGGKWTPTPQTRIDTALFRIKTDNEIVTSLSVGGRTAFTNAQQTLRQGLEISARHLWNPHWRTLLSATAINAQYGDNTPLAGKYLPGIPRQQLFSSIAWSEKGFQHGNRNSVSGKEANLDWVARSRLWANDSNDASGTAIGYGMLNARVRQHFHWGQAQVVAFVGIDNLTDKRTVSSVIINQANKQFFEPALPRNGVIGVTAKLAL